MSMTRTEREATQRGYDEDDDQEDYTMPHRYAAANGNSSDREISLGTGTILALFFALALVCSVFFGMGYTMGHKSTPPVTVASSESSTRSLSDAFKAFKPSASTPGAASPNKTATIVDPEDPKPSSPTAVVVSTQNTKPITPAAKKPFDPDAEIVSSVDPKPTPAIHPAAATVSTAATPAATPSGTAIVQVSAVSHQEDADTLVAALKRKGYTVVVRHEPSDRFLHIQLGPYPTKKDAEAMRLRLQADGYNAILK